MACIYLLAGIFLLVKGWYILSPVQNKGIGILFVIYSVFRGYRAFVSSGTKKSENSDTLV
jgi:hypothetical protein